MAYTAKCDTAAATKWWITGTGSAVNRLSEVMDDNAAGVEENDNPGHYQPWATFMTEHVENGLYQIHLPFEIGDGSTPTTLESFDEFVYFDNAALYPLIKASAVFNIGKIGGGSAPVQGAAWRWRHVSAGNNMAGTNTTFNVYASMIMLSIQGSGSGPSNWAGAPTFERVIISQEGSSQLLDWITQSTNLSIKYTYITDGRNTFNCKGTPATAQDVTIGRGGLAPIGAQGNDSTLTNMNWYDTGTEGIIDMWHPTAMVFIFKNPKKPLAGDFRIRNADACIIYEQYTANIKIVDYMGNALENATVLCEDTFGNQIFLVTTDASGDIAEQVINYKHWYGISETEVSYSPHKFTISLAGYETLILENVAVDHKVEWHLALRPQRARAYGRSHRIQVAQFV